MAPKRRAAKIAETLVAASAAASESSVVEPQPDSMPPPPPKKARKAKKEKVESEETPLPPEATPAEEPEKEKKKKTDGEGKKKNKKKTKDDGPEGKRPKKDEPATPSPAPEPEETPVSKPAPKKKVSNSTIEAPTFPITWSNHGKLMEFYSITEEEATTILLQVQGPDKSAEHFWGKFRKTPDSPAPAAASSPPATSAATAKAAEPVDLTPDTPPPKKLTKSQLELISDAQLPESMSDDDGEGFDGGHAPTDCDGDDGDTSISSTSSTNSDSPNDGPSAGSVAIPKSVEGPVIDTLDTQPAEEAVIEPVAVACGDPGAEARAELNAKVNAVPTPVRSCQVWGKQNCKEGGP